MITFIDVKKNFSKMNLNYKKINVIKKLIIDFMNIDREQIYFFKKNNFKKKKNIKLNEIIKKN